ncbi:MAG: SDR family NAD(P)-dependent oxidoreductase [Alphaproteobacteria bacterium]
MGMYERFRLDGKVAVVTGGSMGIGEGIALALAECGADVVVCARREGPVQEVAEKIKALGRRSFGASVDVLDFTQLPKLLDRVVDEFGSLDIMVNNAGGNLDRQMHPLPDITEAKWDEQMNLNSKTKFWGSQQAAKRMTNGGRIINISSIAAHQPSPGFGTYSTANLGVIAMSRTMAVELGPKGITVNVICPGVFVTESLTETMKVSKEQAEEMFASNIPVGRTGRIEDCGAAAVFFASPAAEFTTGQYINVAGGQ